MKRILIAGLLTAGFMLPAGAQQPFFCQVNGKCNSTVATVAPTATTFSTALAAPAANRPRFSCVITNIGTTQGYCQAKPPGGSTPTTANAVPVAANGGQFYCSSPGSPAVIQDEVDCTCASGTCAFVVNSTGQ